MALLDWQNLIFLLPMLAALAYSLLMAAGLGFGEHSIEVDHDADLDMGHDFDAAVERDLETDHDAGHVGHAGIAARLLGMFGVGRVPLSILVLSVCFLWGAVGLALNVWLGTANMLRVLGLTALAAVLGTRLLAEGLATLMPGDESYHTTREELVGLAGAVLYEVTPTSGTVRLRDPTGNLLDLDCRIHSGDGIKAAQRVVLDEYDPSADVFFVRMS